MELMGSERLSAMRAAERQDRPRGGRDEQLFYFLDRREQARSAAARSSDCRGLQQLGARVRMLSV